MPASIDLKRRFQMIRPDELRIKTTMTEKSKSRKFKISRPNSSECELSVSFMPAICYLFCWFCHLVLIHVQVLFLNIDSNYYFLRSYRVHSFVYANSKDSVSSPFQSGLSIFNICSILLIGKLYIFSINWKISVQKQH